MAGKCAAGDTNPGAFGYVHRVDTGEFTLLPPSAASTPRRPMSTGTGPPSATARRPPPIPPLPTASTTPPSGPSGAADAASTPH
ncbi:hypothetical protein [Streptomyces canus]|uniref:hypothetical protein n=1 Tax=Streptomyces canus TaxID=58343 RepID=UPI0033A26C80